MTTSTDAAAGDAAQPDGETYDKFRRLASENLGSDYKLTGLSRVAGGASRQTWLLKVTRGATETTLIARLEAGGVARREALPLALEHRLIEAAVTQGVLTPKPIALDTSTFARPALLMEYVAGRTDGPQIVRSADLAHARALIPKQLAEQFALIHAIDPNELAFLPRRQGARRVLELLAEELHGLDELHPVLDYVIQGLQDLAPPEHETASPVVVHSDIRVGNIIVDPEAGLVAILDWEIAHLGDPVEDLAWPTIRQWRFGRDDQPLSGIGPIDEYLREYCALTGRDVSTALMDYWEAVGNVRWAFGCMSQAQRHLSGKDRSIEYAALGRLMCKPEFEALLLYSRLADRIAGADRAGQADQLAKDHS